ncbi:Zn-dependent hydrolase [Aneurinibacillus sp. Ricciae_BoGa-3]|uniref:Zn-dependent hydrolase n=1 Tax=Aneurinibacillus sp. Ricciae_BoGa-3 TaxID=3022697 RepID=UPI002341E61E|nr:Zn-dependent hydrolase [Aneurinibacillus sp. Ricciae_BoGa-3]WCK55168.1 Zn-dependent hydrolase [Aneurinibacillus sp. Ricciae_BoGa-3]
MVTTYAINAKRIAEHITRLGEIGRTADGGVHRMALSEEDRQAQALVTQWMEEAGMQVRLDNFGNLIGRKEGTNPNASLVMLGSHIDSVPNGGKFDGIIGVVGAIEGVRALQEAGIALSHPVEVVAFCDEEGPRFNGGLFGSRGMVGRIEQKDLQHTDLGGITRYEALQQFGLQPDRMAESIRKKGEVGLYLEMHIEQGPYLEAAGKAVGIVTGIAGPVWLNIRITGEAGHAGTVPMNMRQDPMVGAAEIIHAIEGICSADPAAPTVGTVGRITAKPGGANVIPESIEFSLDIRDTDPVRRDHVFNKVKDFIQQVCDKRKLKHDVQVMMEVPPMNCASHVIETMTELSQKLSLDAPHMISGAGHDAMLLAEITDIGMIFVRCRKGISHSPKEWADTEDIAKGTQLLTETLLRYARA